MVAASRIVCALAAFCGTARAAPTVTYDQRQNGEFNLQVEADGVAVVLLPVGGGDLFDRKHFNALAGGDDHKWQQIFGRHNGGGNRIGNGALRKKKKKPAQNCTSTAVQPENPYYSESPVSLPVSSSPAPESSDPSLLVVSSPATYAPESPVPSVSESSASSLPESPASSFPDSSDSTLSKSPAAPSLIESPSASSVPQSQENAAEVSASVSGPQERPADGPEDLDVRHGGADRFYIRPGVSVEDPYSVTPNTPDIVYHQDTDDDDDDHDDHAAIAAASTATETNSVATAERRTGVQISEKSSDASFSKAPAENGPSSSETKFEEKPVSVSSDVKIIEKPTNDDDETKGGVEAASTAQAKPADTEPPQTEDKPVVEKTLSEHGQAHAESSDKSDVDAKKINEPAAVEMVAMKTVEKPTFSEALKVVKKQPLSDAAATKGETSEKPGEMVAMKTVEKPTSSESLKVVKKQPVSDAAVTKSAAATGEPNGKPAEMVAMKTIGKPSTPAEETGTAKPAEATAPREHPAVKGDGPTAAEPDAAKTGLKPTEMVAVKTVGSPAAVSTVKSAVSVKTAVRPGTPKTALPASNGTAIMRKVSDRRPLPSITLEVSPAKLVV